MKAHAVKLPPITCHDKVMSYTEFLCELMVELGCRGRAAFTLGDTEP